MDADELIIDSFAGGGGASLGIMWATGRAPDIAINHDRSAIEMHAANHPDTVHVLEDVWKTDLRKLIDGRRVGLAWFSPDCFPADTLVMTKSGLRPIQSVEVGELVMTHKARWRAVTSKLTHTAETVCVRGHGHYGLVTTPSHKFYSKLVVTRYRGPKQENGRRAKPVRVVDNSYWPEAKSMAEKLWATPICFPESEIPTARVQFSADFFYWVGRWVGDGSINKGDLEISCGLVEAEAFKQHMEAHPLKNSEGEVIPFRVNEQGPTQKVIWGCQSLATWCRDNFGDASDLKTLPLWCFTMQRDWRDALLRGYVDADGCDEADNVIGTTTVSKKLGVSVRILAATLGLAACMYKTEGAPGQIEGREFIARDQYRLRWREQLQRETVWRDTRHMFTPVREVTDSGVQEVISLQVDEDESFVADGIVVHNCKHFSRAKGGKPVEKGIRSLAWIVCKWAEQVRPRVICLENVREFSEWSPLVPRLVCLECGWKGTEGQAVLMRVRRRCPHCESRRLKETLDLVPDPQKKGVTFRRFVARLKNLGYEVEWRNMDAADYGAPTHRRRLFLVARCDGQPIEWPNPSHGKGLKPYRTAAECIDWNIECPSIFDRKRPLAEKTMRRIALGIHRYVLTASKPFVVQLAHGEGKSGRWGAGSNSIDDPLGTIHSGGGNHAVVNPVLQKVDGDVQSPFVVQTSHTGTTGRGAYVWSPEDPVRTISQRGEFGIVTPVLSKFHGAKSTNDSRCKQLELPFNTLDTQPRFALLTPHLVTVGHGERPGQDARAATLEKPLGTITSKGHHALVSAFLAKHFGGMVGVEVETPLPTTTTKGCQTQLVAANLIHLNHGGKQWSDMSDPMWTVMSGGTHAALVYSFLTRFFGQSIGQSLNEPAPTANSCNKTGLVTVVIDGELFVIVDIGMRMLTPRELARAQGMPDTYILTGTKTSQVARIGNSVCPPIAAAIVEANCVAGSYAKGAGLFR